MLFEDHCRSLIRFTILFGMVLRIILVANLSGAQAPIDIDVVSLFQLAISLHLLEQLVNPDALQLQTIHLALTLFAEVYEYTFGSVLLLR